MLRFQRALPFLTLAVSTGCVGKESDYLLADHASVIQSILDDSASSMSLAEGGSRRAVLYVDASCPNSLYALERTLADSAARSEVVLQYYPQIQRDPVAKFETIALECAHRMGALPAYVTQRLDDASAGLRPVDMSATSIGLLKRHAANSERQLGCWLNVHQTL